MAEAQTKVARRLRAANGLLALRAALVGAEVMTGNPAYRSAGRAVQWAIDRLQDTE
ncbi:hypothetical protein ABZ791_12435 [Streptomyces huasconensis]|uniref:Uncharacterized protein n=1 Tax=Streptomyces huasconensis TaxID=1854574 RepID=A0ABV3LQ97_9ACTN